MSHMINVNKLLIHFTVELSDFRSNNYVDFFKEYPLFSRALLFFNKKHPKPDWKNAEIEYIKLLKINPKNANYNHGYACILCKSGSGMEMKIDSTVLNKALKYCTNAVQLSPNNIRFRFTKIHLLMYCNRHEEVQNEFKTLFELIASNNKSFDSVTTVASILDRFGLFHEYAIHLHDIKQYEHAAKYMQYAVDRMKYDVDIDPRQEECDSIEAYFKANLHLSIFYYQCDELNKSLNILENMKSRWNPDSKQKGMSYLINFGEIYLKLQEYQKAYECLQCALNCYHRRNQIEEKVMVYPYLLICCSELGKFKEADLLYDEAKKTMGEYPKFLGIHFNSVRMDLLRNYIFIKRGDIMKAIDGLNKILDFRLNFCSMGDEGIEEVYYYLGLAYKQFKTKYYMTKAKKMFFYSINCVAQKNTIYFWEFALILWRTKEYYLCKKYANISWKRTQEIKCIKNKYPILKKKLNEKIIKLKCANCSVCNESRKNKKLKVCKGCHRMYYCNKQCQKLHWLKVHRSNCNKFWIELQKQIRSTSKSTIIQPFTKFEHLQIECSELFQS
eukprot:371774_1